MTEGAESHDSQLRIAPTKLPDECEPWLIHLRVLAVKKRLRGEQKLLWQYMWNMAGCQPGRVVADLVEARKALGFSDTAIRRHLNKLVKVGLLEICYWAGPGQPRVELADPAEVLTDDPEQPPLRVVGCDPQRWFPFFREADTALQATPKVVPEAAPTPETTPETVPEAAPEGENADPSMDTIEGTKPNPPSPHRTTRSMDHETAPAENVTPPVPDQDSNIEAMRSGYAVAAALESFGEKAHPRRQKQRLIDEINEALQDPKTDSSIPGRAADLVVNGDVPYEDLQNLLGEICGIREAYEAGRGPGFTKSAGAYFLARVRKWRGWKEPKGSAP